MNYHTCITCGNIKQRAIQGDYQEVMLWCDSCNSKIAHIGCTLEYISGEKAFYTSCRESIFESVRSHQGEDNITVTMKFQIEFGYLPIVQIYEHPVVRRFVEEYSINNNAKCENNFFITLAAKDMGATLTSYNIQVIRAACMTGLYIWPELSNEEFMAALSSIPSYMDIKEENVALKKIIERGLLVYENHEIVNGPHSLMRLIYSYEYDNIGGDF